MTDIVDVVCCLNSSIIHTKMELINKRYILGLGRSINETEFVNSQVFVKFKFEIWIVRSKSKQIWNNLKCYMWPISATRAVASRWKYFSPLGHSARPLELGPYSDFIESLCQIYRSLLFLTDDSFITVREVHSVAFSDIGLIRQFLQLWLLAQGFLKMGGVRSECYTRGRERREVTSVWCQRVQRGDFWSDVKEERFLFFWQSFLSECLFFSLTKF